MRAIAGMILLGLASCGSEEPCVGEDVMPRALRRLTPVEYQRTVSDLLGVDATGVAPDVGDPVVDGFRNDAEALTVGLVLADRYRSLAEELAYQVALSAHLPCSPQEVGDEACASQFILTFGERAFRRPLTRDEMTPYLDLWREVAGRETFADGIRWVIATMLQSPHFLYRSELGVRVGRRQYELTDWEMATALSYGLWGTMPDRALFEAAAAGALSADEEIEAQIARMVADPRAHQVVVDFVGQWLGLDEVATVDRVGLTVELAQARLEDSRARVAAAASGSLADLFEAGLLTDPTLLTVHARSMGSSPVHRGLLVRERLLCEDVPEPPADIDLSLEEIDRNVTTRELFAQHTANPVCAECHASLDPIGNAFEHYDHLGAYRDTELEQPIDASGDLDGVVVNGVEELTQALLADPRFPACFAQSWRRYASGMPACGQAQPADVALHQPLTELLASPLFRRRKGALGEGDTLAVDAP